MTTITLTFNLDDHTIQISNGEILIWIDGDTSHEADITLRIADMQRILSAAHLLGAP